MMNKSFFKVKKSCGSAWSLWLSHSYCDNNTVKTHHVNRSDFFKENLAF